jgi:F1F0 ATPase subunit 2
MLVRLEMDEQRMSIPASDTLVLAWVKLLGLAPYLAAGAALGVLYFRGLAWIVSRLIGDGRILTIIALMILRFIVLGGLLTLASFAGALHMLAVTLGVFIGRSVVLHRTREATS